MADTATQSAAFVNPGTHQTPVKAKKVKKVKNPRTKPSPPTSEMVINAIKGLKERGGSSSQVMKKYVAANYKVNTDKVAPFIKKYLKTAVTSGSPVQTMGKGASGSFKLASTSSSQGVDKKKYSTSKLRSSPAQKAATGDVQKAAVKKSAVKAKKECKPVSAVKTKKPTGSGEKKSAKSKSPSNAKSQKTGPTKKPKVPKPKTAKPGASKAPKKVSSPKRKK